MKLSELKYLDPQDIGNWPLLPKSLVLAGLFVVTIGAGYFLDWNSQLETLTASEEQELKLRDSYKDKTSQAINLDLYQKQLADIETTFSSLLRQLPNKEEMEALLREINQSGIGRGLQFELFKPAQKETVSEFYSELPVSIRIVGKYHDLGGFASDISMLSRIVTLNDLNLSLSKDGKDGLLVMDVTAKTYRYLDEKEIAAQKAELKKNKKNKESK